MSRARSLLAPKVRVPRAMRGENLAKAPKVRQLNA
jgi:hypothetical protein